MRRSLLTVGIVTLLVAGLAAANLRRDLNVLGVDWRLVPLPPHEVLAEPPARGPIVQTITAPGTVESVEEAEITSQLIGRIVEVGVKDGDQVKDGDLLVRLDDTDARARLDSALARIDRLKSSGLQAQSDLEKALRDEGQLSRLKERGVSTPTELADARTLVAKARAALTITGKDLAESQTMRITAQKELDRTVIRAPIVGVISGLNVEVGEIVIAGTTNLPGSVLMTISNLDRMRVRADVDETDVPLVRSGQPARVYLQADLRQAISGSVDRIAAKGKVKGEVTSFETLIDVVGDHAGAFWPGMTSTVEVEVKRATEALGVPVQAVIHRRRKDLPSTPAVREWAERNARSPGEKAAETSARYIKIVFVAEGGVARARPVETGLSDERRVEILSGLRPEDRVIVGPFRALDELKDGHPVLPVQSLSAEAGPS